MLSDYKYIRNAVSYDNKLYFVSGNYDDLMEIDVENNWNIRSVCKFPWKLPKGAVDCFIDGTKIWCIAMWGIQIASYDFMKNQIEYYSAKDYNRENISTAYLNNILWIFPRNLPGPLVGFSVTDKKFLTNKSWEFFCVSNQINSQIMIGAVDRDDTFMVLKGTKKILRFNLTENSFKVYKLPIAEDLYGVARVGGTICLTVVGSKKIYVFKPQIEDIQAYQCVDSEAGQYYRPINIDDKLLLCDANKLYVFDNGSFKTLDIKTIENSKHSFFFSGLKMGKKYFFLPWNAKQALETDLNFENAKTYKLPYLLETVEHWIRRTQIIKEEDMSLQEYLTAVIKMDQEDTKQIEESISIGEIIHRTCI